MEHHLRWACEHDYDALGDVMFDAVRNGESHYTEEQRRAWVPVARRGQEWISRLAAQHIVLAETNGHIQGFMSLAGGGYIDFAYIRPEAQHTGLFRLLFERIADRARLNGESLLWVYASLMAEPAFSALGFTVTQREEVVVKEEILARFKMQKFL